MYRVQRRQTLGFESLIRLIKQLSAECANGMSERTPQKLKLLMQRASQRIEDHPFHAPVVALQVSRVTSRLNVSGRYRCRTCGGSCEYVHMPLIKTVQHVLPYQSVKGITQLYAVYSSCRNPLASLTVLELEIRSALLIYNAIRGHKDGNEDIDADVRNYVDKIKTSLEKSGRNDLNEGVLGQFLHGHWAKPHSHKCFSETDHIGVSLRDICEVIASVGDNSHARDLLLYLGMKALEQWDKSDLSHEDIKSICRILECLRKARCSRECITSIAKNMKQHVAVMNARDVGCLLSLLGPEGIYDIDRICDRVEELIKSPTDSKDSDIRCLSVLIKELGPLCEFGGQPKCAQTIALCLVSMVIQIKRDPKILSKSDSFRALAISLEVIHSLRWIKPLQPAISELWECCVRYRSEWLHSGSLYDLNELLKLMGDFLCTSHMYEVSKYNSSITEDGITTELKELIECISKRLSKELAVEIDRHRIHGAKSDTKFMRDLCLFLRLCLRQPIKKSIKVSEEFNDTVSRLLADNNHNMKPMDVRDISLYVQQACHGQAIEGILHNA